MKARKKPTLKSMTAFYKKKGFLKKDALICAREFMRGFMRGFNDAKKYRVR